MAKSFKVVCITNKSSGFLKCGEVFDAKMYADHDLRYLGFVSVSKVDGCQDYQYMRDYFLRLPTEPKTCADMSMEEYLAMVCLDNSKSTEIEFTWGAEVEWFTRDSTMALHKCGTALCRVKPDKSVKDIEIERIEEAMRKLADDLSKLKRE